MASLGLRPIHLQPLPYRSPESPSSMGRGGPWASRQDAPQKMAGGPMWPPLCRIKRRVRFSRRGRSQTGPQIYAARPGGRALRFSTSQHLLSRARRGTGTASAAILEQPGPSGPGEISTSHSDFARRKFCFPRQVRVPRNGGAGESGPMDLGGAKRSRSPSAASPAILWFLSHRWERNSPPALRPQARFGAQPPRSGGS